MPKALQVLIAVACIIVIAAGGWWLYDRNELREAQKREQEIDRAVAKAYVESKIAERDAQKEKVVQACRDDLAARENGSIVAFMAKGGDMMTEVRKCQDLVNSATPSE